MSMWDGMVDLGIDSEKLKHLHRDKITLLGID